MHFYKDTALQEDKCKTNKGAFSLSILRSIVINILHLNRIENIGREIVNTTQNLAEALMLFSMIKLEYGFFNLKLGMEWANRLQKDRVKRLRVKV